MFTPIIPYLVAGINKIKMLNNCLEFSDLITSTKMTCVLSEDSDQPVHPKSDHSLHLFVFDCRSRGCEFEPGLVPYFRGD